MCYMNPFIISVSSRYTLSNEHTLIDKKNWQLPMETGMIEAIGVGVLTVDEDRDVKLQPIQPIGSRDLQDWTLGRKRLGWYTIEIYGAYLTCHKNGYLTVEDLHPDLSVPGMYIVQGVL